MNDRVFLDTNILIYAHDTNAGSKHSVASKLVSRIWENGNGAVSTQVLQEFYVNVTRKLREPLSRTKARELVTLYAQWFLQEIGLRELESAMAIEQKCKVSFWDALILAAAQSARASSLISEDLNNGQVVGGVRVTNPFVRQK